MLITCRRKGCLQTTEAKLNRKTNEVVCMACGEVIEAVTPYMKKMLDAAGQILRSFERQPFQVYCPACSAQRSVTLIADVAKCATCGGGLTLARSFLKALKQHLAEKKNEENE